MSKYLKSVIDEYYTSVYKFGLYGIVMATMVSAIFYGMLYVIGNYPDTPLAAVIYFEITALIYTYFCLREAKNGFDGDRLKSNSLKRAKILITIIMFDRWNCELYIFPTESFWAFGMLFHLMFAFFLDLKLMIFHIVSMWGFLAAAIYIIPEHLMPEIPDHFDNYLYVMLTILALEPSALVFFMKLIKDHLITAKTDQMVENNKRLTQVINKSLPVSRSLREASAELQNVARNLSESSNTQASTSEEVSSAMEQMSATIEQNADNSIKTQQVMSNTVGTLKETTSAVEIATNKIKEVAQKVSIIDEIASRTDLLAVNAAIEASRAGESGKGFSVVASEIRKLAVNTQIAAKEIATEMNEGLDKVKKSNFMIEKLVPEIGKALDLVNDITASCKEQRNGAMQVNLSMQNLNSSTAENTSMAEQLVESSQHQKQIAEDLDKTLAEINDNESDKEEMDQLKAQIDKAMARLMELRKQN